MNLRRKLRRRTRLHQCRPHRIPHKIVQHGRLPKAPLGLRGMHIHIHLARRQLQKQQHHRIHRRRNNISISLRQPMLYQPVANQPSIHEYINRVAIQLLDLRLRNKPMQPHLACLCGAGAPPAFVVLVRFFLPPPPQSTGPAFPSRTLDTRARYIPPPEAPPASHSSPNAIQNASPDAPARNASPTKQYVTAQSTPPSKTFSAPEY